MNSERGQLTLEFMLAIILIVSVSTVLGILTFTLSLTEVLQYVTYSGARSYMAGDFHVQDQVAAGDQKVHNLLVGLPFLSGALASGWITVPKNQRGSGNNPTGPDQSYVPYSQQLGVSQIHNQFEGYQLKFTVPILDVQIPFIKDVISPPNGAQSFGATLSSFLMREPTFDECQSYMNAAFGIIKNQYSGLQYLSDSVVILDNGC